MFTKILSEIFLFKANTTEARNQLKDTINILIENLKQYGYYPPSNMDYKITNNENSIEITCNNIETYNYFNKQIN